MNDYINPEAPDYTKLTNVKLRNREDLVISARKYIGVPFRHRGRDRNGIDCGGLIVRSLQDLGYNPPDMTLYSREPQNDGLRTYLNHAIGPGARTQVRYPQPGDVVLIAFDGKTPQHVAIVARHPTAKNGAMSLIHSYGEAKMVVEHGYDRSWLTKTFAVFRFEIDADAPRNENCTDCQVLASKTDNSDAPPVIDASKID